MKTPSRMYAVKRMAWKSYGATASTLIMSPTMLQPLLTKIAMKIREEMRDLSSASHDSILHDTVEAVKNFSWKTVHLELLDKMPTMMALLEHITDKSPKKAPLPYLIGSMILKSQHQHIGLVKRAIYVMVHGFGTSKQVREHYI